MGPRTPQLGALGRAIEAFRKKSGHSQEELGARLNLAATHISRLERGLRSPTYDTLIRIAAALETSVGALTTLADQLYDQLPANQKRTSR